MPTLSPTLHHSNWVLHSGPKDVGSKHSGKILNIHLVFIGVRLNLIQKPEQTEAKNQNLCSRVTSPALTAPVGFYSVKLE